MNKVLICLFVVFLAIGCTTTSTPTCEQDHTFSMEFTNGSNDSYDLYINGKFQQVMGAKSKEIYDIPAGYWSAEVIQSSGYTGDPYYNNYSGTYESCTNYYIVF